MTRPDRPRHTVGGVSRVARDSEPLDLDRAAILAYRRRVGALDARLPRTAASLRRVAWAGLQDSVPRAALLALHARVDGIRPDDWEHPSLAQLWGPRFSVFVVARRDVPVFSLGTLPDDERGRRQAVEPRGSSRGAPRRRHPHVLVGRAHHGRAPGPPALCRRDRPRPHPLGRRAPAHGVDRGAARHGSARRPPRARAPLAPRRRSVDACGVRHVGGDRATRRSTGVRGARSGLRPVGTPLGEAWILASDEAAFREAASAPAIAGAGPDPVERRPVPDGGRPRAPRPGRRPPARAVPAGNRLARWGHGGGRAGRARGAAPRARMTGALVAPPVTRRARGGRGRGGDAPAPRAPGRDPGRLGRLTSRGRPVPVHRPTDAPNSGPTARVRCRRRDETAGTAGVGGDARHPPVSRRHRDSAGSRRRRLRSVRRRAGDPPRRPSASPAGRRTTRASPARR